MAFRLPVLEWLPGYRWSDLPRDVRAGLLGTASTAPEAMAYALLAGLPAQMGLYALLLPLLVYVALGTSRELSIAPTAPLAALLAVTVTPLAAGDPARYVSLAILVTWVLGGILFVAGLLRLGFVAGLVSRPVLAGYLVGAGLLILAAQVAAVMGGKPQGFNLPAILRVLASSSEGMNLAAAALGLGLLGLIVALHAVRLEAVAAAAAVAVGTVLVAVFELDVPVVGRIPAGLPPLTLPAPGSGALAEVTVLGLSLALLVFLDSSVIARHFATEKGYGVDPDQELRALGAANLTAGLTGAVPVSGNLADSVLLAEAGARSPMTGVVTFALVLASILAGIELANMPLAAFAAIVIHGVLRPAHLALLRRTWRFDRAEFASAIVCLLGVVGLGLIRGLLLAVTVTVLLLLHRASRPRVTDVGVVDAPRPALVDRDRTPDARALANTLLLRPIGGLIFASAPAVTDRIRGLAHAARADVRLVILDLSRVPVVDLTACELLDRLQRDLEARGIQLVVARANAGVATRLGRFAFEPPLQLAGGTAELLDLLHLPPEAQDLA